MRAAAGRRSPFELGQVIDFMIANPSANTHAARHQLYLDRSVMVQTITIASNTEQRNARSAFVDGIAAQFAPADQRPAYVISAGSREDCGRMGGRVRGLGDAWTCWSH